MSLRHALLTVFGLGLLRPAPGTWGSAPVPAIAVVLVWLLGPSWMVHAIIVLIGLLFAITCVRFGGWAEQRFGQTDPAPVVADEVAGQCLALLLLPWRGPADREAWLWNIALAATAFFAFRFFDILKPPPVGALQRLPGGWGILLDDVLAGVYALGATHLLAWLVWPSILD